MQFSSWIKPDGYMAWSEYLADAVAAARTRAQWPRKHQEKNWQCMRQNWFSNRIFKSFDDIVDRCCYA